MAGRTRKSTKARKPGKAKNLAKTVVALAATALLEEAVHRVARDPAFRRKVVALVQSAQKRASKATGAAAKRLKKSTSKS
jgi:hypothetical protein